MIERINLIEKERLQLTYEKLLKAAGLVVGLCVAGFFYLKLEVNRLETKISRTRSEIGRLEQSKDTILKATPPKTSGGRFAPIEYAFNESPDWAKLIRDLSFRLPPAVWLTHVQGSIGTLSGVEENTDKKTPKKGGGGNIIPPAKKGMTLSGMAHDLRNVGRFVTELERSPLIQNVTLVSTTKEEGHFTFVVSCDMVKGKS